MHTMFLPNCYHVEYCNIKLLRRKQLNEKLATQPCLAYQSLIAPGSLAWPALPSSDGDGCHSQQWSHKTPCCCEALWCWPRWYGALRHGRGNKIKDCRMDNASFVSDFSKIWCHSFQILVLRSDKIIWFGSIRRQPQDWTQRLRKLIIPTIFCLLKNLS